MFRHGEIVKKRLFQKDDILFEEGDPGNAAYIVESGSIAIHKTVDGRTFRLATLRPGELFGEMSIIDGSPRMASAVALENSVIIEIPRDLLEEKLEEYDAFLQALIKILAINLRNVHRVYLKRTRSIHDFLNVVAFQCDNFDGYLNSIEASDATAQAKEHVATIEESLQHLSYVFDDLEDRRRSVMSGADL